MSFQTEWQVQYLSIDEDVRADPTNPLAMQKRAHAICEVWCVSDTAPSNQVGETLSTLSFYIGSTPIEQGPVTGATKWYCVNMTREFIQEGVNWARTVERWESWAGDGNESGWSAVTIV